MSFVIETDFSNVQAWDGVGGTALPPGIYVFEVADAEQALSQASEPVLKMTLKVVETLQVNEGTEDQTGQTMIKSYSLKPEKWPMARLKCFLVATGAPLSQFTREDLLGRSFQGTIQQRTGPGKNLPNGTVGEPKVYADLVGEVALAQPEVAAPAPARGRVVGASANKGNGAAAARPSR
jgi:hypothetical protein